MLSTKSRYGLRALLYMALKNKGDKISIKEIGEKENISVRYLEQIFNSLKQGGIIKSIKGAGGGYLFAKNLNEITLKDIFQILEKDLYCNLEENNDNNTLEYTLNKYVWNAYNDNLINFLESLNLEDLALKHNENQVLMYYI